jgi:LCP family protein required for cell wall assembly
MSARATHRKGKVVHRRPSRKGKSLRFGATVACAAAVAIGTFATLSFQNLDHNLTGVNINEALGKDRPAATKSEGPHAPMNVLLIGSDSREGQSKVAGQTPGLSDTTILVHVSADRRRITAASIARDTMVERPDCKSKDGKKTVRGGLSMFNAAYSIGGPACTQRTVEQLTGIRIDHFVVVDLAGFTKMVDAVGGVPICVPEEVNDSIGRIHLDKGRYTANGETALNYVRERHALSANGDIGRMKRQQAFLASMANKALSQDVLTDPKKLYAFLDATTESLTTDSDLASLTKMASLASEVSAIDASNIKFLSVPVETYPRDHNRLQWTSAADKLWKSFKEDQALPRSMSGDVTKAREKAATVKPSGTTSPSATPKPQPKTTVKKASPASNGLCS